VRQLLAYCVFAPGSGFWVAFPNEVLPSIFDDLLKHDHHGRAEARMIGALRWCQLLLCGHAASSLFCCEHHPIKGNADTAAVFHLGETRQVGFAAIANRGANARPQS
jgi:hypothetical protein